MAKHHVEDVTNLCNRFLDALLREKCPKNVYTRLWSFKVDDALKLRFDDSIKELEKIMKDIKSYSITYNYYYTNTIKKRRRERKERSLVNCIKNAIQHVILLECNSNHISAQVDARKATREYSIKLDSNMKNHNCEEALDCLFSIYKVSERLHILGPLSHIHVA
jgi:hypothetical protein